MGWSGRRALYPAGVPQQDIELVESAFQAWNRGDIEAFAGHLAEDVAWLEVSGRPEGEDAEMHGRARLRRSLESMLDAWESYRLELLQVHDAGHHVVAVVRERARGRASGVDVDSTWGYLITLAEGAIVRVEAYRNPAQALAAAGPHGSETGA
jgi:ketosteroid isomerase-like protein